MVLVKEVAKAFFSYLCFWGVQCLVGLKETVQKSSVLVTVKVAGQDTTS